ASTWRSTHPRSPTSSRAPSPALGQKKSETVRNGSITMMRRFCAAVVFVVGVAAAGSTLSAETRPINADQSTLTVFVYKSGLFSAFADNHTVKAPVATGSISDEAPLSVELTVHSSALRVLDPDLSADKRADVQARMLSADVLDSARFPE